MGALPPNLSELDDPLAVVEQRLAALDAAGARPAQRTSFLREATGVFLRDRRYRNDPRYLRLWLALAACVKDAEAEVFRVLAGEDVASDLAAYYEAYAAWLAERGRFALALEVLERGVARGAAPAERLARTLAAMRQRAGAAPKAETPPAVRAMYALPVDAPWAGGREVQFEEVRARAWRPASAGVLHALPSGGGCALDDDDTGPAVDADDLTRISIYRDTTVDIREMARTLADSPPTGVVLALSREASAALAETHLPNAVRIADSPRTNQGAAEPALPTYSPLAIAPADEPFGYRAPPAGAAVAVATPPAKRPCVPSTPHDADAELCLDLTQPVELGLTAQSQELAARFGSASGSTSVLGRLDLLSSPLKRESAAVPDFLAGLENEVIPVNGKGGPANDCAEAPPEGVHPETHRKAVAHAQAADASVLSRLAAPGGRHTIGAFSLFGLRLVVEGDVAPGLHRVVAIDAPADEQSYALRVATGPAAAARLLVDAYVCDVLLRGVSGVPTLSGAINGPLAARLLAGGAQAGAARLVPYLRIDSLACASVRSALSWPVAALLLHDVCGVLGDAAAAGVRHGRVCAGRVRPVMMAEWPRHGGAPDFAAWDARRGGLRAAALVSWGCASPYSGGAGDGPDAAALVREVLGAFPGAAEPAAAAAQAAESGDYAEAQAVLAAALDAGGWMAPGRVGNTKGTLRAQLVDFEQAILSAR